MVSNVTAAARAMMVHRIEAPPPASPAQFGQPLELTGGDASAVSQLHTLVLAPQASVQVQQAWADFKSDALALRDAKAAGAYGLATMAPTPTLTPTAPRMALEDVSTLGFLPDARSDQTSTFRAELSDLRDAARREQQLSDQRGHAVKIAYDPNADMEVALDPGDPGYDGVMGARAQYAHARTDLGKMGVRLSDFADLLDL